MLRVRTYLVPGSFYEANPGSSTRYTGTIQLHVEASTPRMYPAKDRARAPSAHRSAVRARKTPEDPGADAGLHPQAVPATTSARPPARWSTSHLDEQLIEDGTYFVHEADGEIVACGGWSRRQALGRRAPRRTTPACSTPGRSPAHPRDVRPPRLDPPRARAGDPGCVRGGRAGRGLRSLILGATRPGEPLYRAGFGRRSASWFGCPTVAVECVVMHRPIRRAR